jgi:tRNA 2-selenouridine synthase
MSEFLLEGQVDDALLSSGSLLDLRAPCEFVQGTLPGSVNLPILNNEERAMVGTIYKEQGPEAAKALGHQLVSGETKFARVQSWVEFIQSHPNCAIFCFRGGLRSQIAQTWLGELGYFVPRLKGGYKWGRSFFLQGLNDFCQQQRLLIVSGATGSGKTKLLGELSSPHPTLDLEGLACHRGSAFGGHGKEQPSQIDFENSIAQQMMIIRRSAFSNPVILEDESRLIGQRIVPGPLFESMRRSPVVIVSESLKSRARTIFDDYILSSPLNIEANSYDPSAAGLLMERYRNAAQRISRRLGGVRTAHVLFLMDKAWEDQQMSGHMETHGLWIEFLLKEYYDPMYESSLERRSPRVLFQGSRSEVLAYLEESL